MTISTDPKNNQIAPNSFFLSFEGIEGAGKSTQIKKSADYLAEKKYRVIQLREPGGTIFGEDLRSAILNSKTKLHPVAEAHLFASSRAQLLFEKTIEELKQPNTIVIYDRYIDSSIAYQGFGRELGPEFILDLHKVYPLNIMPHRTIYIRIDLKTSLHRQKIRGLDKDYFESQDSEFYEKLICGLDYAAKKFPERIKIIDGTLDTDDVFGQITNSLDQLIK